MPIVEIKDLRRVLLPKTRLMGIDHAARKIGLALSNPELTVVTPLKTLSGKNFTENLKALCVLCREFNVGGFVIGLPLNMDGTEGPRAQATRSFVRNLAIHTDLPVTFWDERLSTAAVTRSLIEQDASRAKRAEVVDRMAAAYILQGLLDRMAVMARAAAHEKDPSGEPEGPFYT